MMEAVASVGPSRERIEPGDGYCDACFTGRYPIPVSDDAKARQLVLFEVRNP